MIPTNEFSCKTDECMRCHISLQKWTLDASVPSSRLLKSCVWWPYCMQSCHTHGCDDAEGDITQESQSDIYNVKTSAVITQRTVDRSMPQRHWMSHTRFIFQSLIRRIIGAVNLRRQAPQWLAGLRDSLGIANTALNSKPPSLIHQRVTQYRVLTLFTALLRTQARYSHEKAVRPSIRSSVWQTEKMFCPDFYTVYKNVYPSFSIQRMVGERWPLLPEIWGQTDPVCAKTIFNRYSLVEPQP